MAEQTTYTRPVGGSSPSGPTKMAKQDIKKPKHQVSLKLGARPSTSKKVLRFQKTVWDFYKKNKRDFPWRKTKDPYKILVSEIMLQQTQADRVVKFYETWINRFPDFKSLAQAKFSEIYPFWQGLGYNRRALALQKTAQKVMAEFGGKLPKDILQLETFPGIGPYTARAVAIFAYQAKIACIETNIRRVFIHHFFGDKTDIEDKQILKIAERALPADGRSGKAGLARVSPGNARKWHWALMDYGAYLKSQVPNPNRRHKNYSVQPKFEGSFRQIRGALLKMLSGKPMEAKELAMRIKKLTGQNSDRTKKVIADLEKEGLIIRNENVYSLN